MDLLWYTKNPKNINILILRILVNTGPVNVRGVMTDQQVYIKNLQQIGGQICQKS